LDNLLAYAFKYTETGAVELKARWEGENTKGNLIFILKDTGLGMEEIPHDDESVEEFTGLGIPIIRSIVKTLGASIRVQSKRNAGTRVRVSIPQEAQSQKKLGEQASQSLARFQSAEIVQAIEPEPMPYGRALVVDDVEACRFLAKGLLGFYEIETDLAENGGEAIEKIINEEAYDIIFMDHIMPEVDGMVATRVIRETGYKLPIVALTANTIFGQETEYLKNGFDAFMAKPINPKEFDAMLRRFIRDKQPQHVLDAVVKKEKAAPQQTEEAHTHDDKHPEVFEKLRQDFARTQRDVYTDITIALGNGKHETAKWHLDTVKNMAGMIGEPVFSKIAADVAIAISNGEIPTRLLEMLNQELTRVLSGIPVEASHEKLPVRECDTQILFEKLKDLLTTDSAECMFLVEELLPIPNSEDLINHIENFDFPKALKALDELRKSTEA
jgi:CheY-like chemotaxis protein